MNELRVALPRFLTALEAFHRDLARSAEAVEEAEKRLLALGDDDFLQQFGAQLRRVKEPTDQYRKGTPRVEAAVNDKIQRVERYFHG
ncbi:hypothetical protein [Arachnia propionica]|uniref:Uncharacterized protein n=1 Tax=Arachnia propionica TaxID=1750 RepID=A0A3P1WSM1_9ACTN|nr:hypothetical protein [Arachnia propionica]RRD48767.1 hypothetical protein EII35_11205 [Arachnia propionica]